MERHGTLAALLEPARAWPADGESDDVCGPPLGDHRSSLERHEDLMDRWGYGPF